MINGLGRFPGGPLSPLAVINVQHGKRYVVVLLPERCEISHKIHLTATASDSSTWLATPTTFSVSMDTT